MLVDSFSEAKEMKRENFSLEEANKILRNENDRYFEEYRKPKIHATLDNIFKRKKQKN